MSSSVGPSPPVRMIRLERLSAARSQPGWIGGQLLRAINDRMLRTIVGTWESRDAWEAWHGEDAFRDTRERLDFLVFEPTAAPLKETADYVRIEVEKWARVVKETNATAD